MHDSAYAQLLQKRLTMWHLPDIEAFCCWAHSRSLQEQVMASDCIQPGLGSKCAMCCNDLHQQMHSGGNVQQDAHDNSLCEGRRSILLCQAMMMASEQLEQLPTGQHTCAGCSVANAVSDCNQHSQPHKHLTFCDDPCSADRTVKVLPCT